MAASDDTPSDDNTPPSPPPALRAPNDADGPWLLRRIWDRINVDDKHFMGCIVGEEGSGKSWTAIRIASEIDPTFDSSERVIFDAVDLLKILRDGDHEPGNVYVLDEAGVQLGRRTWQQRGQILMNQALQIIRDENLGLIFTLPRLSELDSQSQGRLQAFYEIIDQEPGEYVIGKWKWMDPDRTDTTGEIYKKYPRRIQEGVKWRITRLSFRPPDPELIAPYKEKKSEFQHEFYQKTIEEHEEEIEEEEAKKLTPGDVVDALKEGDALDAVVSIHGVTGEPYVDGDLVREEYGLTVRAARTVKKLAERDDGIDLSGYS